MNKYLQTFNANVKYTFFYTYDKTKKIIFDEKGKELPLDNILYEIIMKYKDMLNYLEDIQIVPNQTMEEADRGLVYKGKDSKNRYQYRYGNLYINRRIPNKLNNFLLVYKKVKEINKLIKKTLDTSNTIINNDFIFSTILLLELTFFIRLGKQKYYDENGTVGLLTLTKKNLILNNEKDVFEIRFKGKSNQQQLFIIEEDKHNLLFLTMLKIYDTLKDKTEDAFIFCNSESKQFTERKLNKRLEKYDLTLKEFRTYGVNLILIKNIHKRLIDVDKNKVENKNNIFFDKEKEIKMFDKLIKNCITETAETIGHSKSISKKSYISEELITVLKDIDVNTITLSFDNFLNEIIKRLSQL